MTAREELLPVVEELYQEAKCSPRTLRPDDRLEEDLGIDSLSAMELLSALEDRYEVNLVNDPRTTQVTTVADLTDLLYDVVAR